MSEPPAPFSVVLPSFKKNNTMKELLKIRTLFVATALALSGCLVSCDDDDNPDRRMDNQMFVSEASSSNMLEIEAGRLAVSKGQREAVRMYGQHICRRSHRGGNGDEKPGDPKRLDSADGTSSETSEPTRRL